MVSRRDTINIYKVKYLKDKTEFQRKYNASSEGTIFSVCESRLQSDTIKELVTNLIQVASSHTHGQFTITFSKPIDLKISAGEYSKTSINKLKNFNILEKIILERELQKQLNQVQSLAELGWSYACLFV